MTECCMCGEDAQRAGRRRCEHYCRACFESEASRASERGESTFTCKNCKRELSCAGNTGSVEAPVIESCEDTVATLEELRQGAIKGYGLGQDALDKLPPLKDMTMQTQTNVARVEPQVLLLGEWKGEKFWFGLKTAPKPDCPQEIRFLRGDSNTAFHIVSLDSSSMHPLEEVKMVEPWAAFWEQVLPMKATHADRWWGEEAKCMFKSLAYWYFLNHAVQNGKRVVLAKKTPRIFPQTLRTLFANDEEDDASLQDDSGDESTGQRPPKRRSQKHSEIANTDEGSGEFSDCDRTNIAAELGNNNALRRNESNPPANPFWRPKPSPSTAKNRRSAPAARNPNDRVARKETSLFVRQGTSEEVGMSGNNRRRVGDSAQAHRAFHPNHPRTAALANRQTDTSSANQADPQRKAVAERRTQLPTPRNEEQNDPRGLTPASEPVGTPRPVKKEREDTHGDEWEYGTATEDDGEVSELESLCIEEKHMARRERELREEGRGLKRKLEDVSKEMVEVKAKRANLRSKMKEVADAIPRKH